MKVREVDTDVGRLSIPDDGSLLSLAVLEHGSFAHALCEALRGAAEPGMTALDAAAGVGYFTRVLARAVGPGGRVLALEPDAEYAALLEHNTVTDAGPQVQVERVAAWREAGEARVSMSDEGTVPTVAVDDLVDSLGVARIDNDGTEHVAVQGMERVIARCRPTMVVNFWPRGIKKLGDNPVAVLDYYRELGYNLSPLETPDLPMDFAAGDLVDAAERSRGARTWLVLAPSVARRGSLVELRATSELVRRGPAPPGRGGVRAQLRGLILRLARPYTAHQADVDRHLLASIEEVRRALLEARGQAEAERFGHRDRLREIAALRAEVERVRSATAEIELLKARLDELERRRTAD